jgi:hypothetical protein
VQWVEVLVDTAHLCVVILLLWRGMFSRFWWDNLVKMAPVEAVVVEVL